MNKNLQQLREQIQEDLLTYIELIDPHQKLLTENDKDVFCNIVVRNFEELAKD